MNAKAASQRYQRQVLDLVRQPGNDVCADCKGRNPRWASHSLGVFLCIQCAGIHRKMGTHISKVKSLTLDEWNKEQVDRMKQMGNIKSNAYYNPDEKRNRPPMNAEEAERDSELERHIRDKYQRRKFIGKLPPPVPVKEAGDIRRSVSPMPSSPARHQPPRPAVGRSTSSSSSSSLSPADGITRSRTAPIVPSTWREAKRAASPLPALPAEANAPAPPAISISTAPQAGAATAASLATPASASSLYPATTPPYLPPRASSAQGILNGAGGSAAGSHFNAANGVGQAGGAAAPLSPNSQFEGRSSVFDDLLSLTKPQQEQQQQAQQLGGMAFGQQQQMMAGPGGAMMGGGAMTGNPWAHLQQQQQSFLNQQMAPMQTGYVNGGGGMAYGAEGGYGGNFVGMDASGLGSMAFGQMQQQPQQQMQQPMMTGYPNGYGSGAFNGSPAPPSPSNPFFQQQQQQQPQQQYYSNGAGAAGQQPVDPYSARATMDQQRLQSGQVFDDWAKGMMPTNAGRR